MAVTLDLLRILRGLGLQREIQFFELLDNFLAMFTYVYFGLYVGDLAFLVHEDRCSRGASAFRVENSISRGNRSLGVTQERIIQLEFVKKLFVLFRGVAAGTKKRDIKLT